jgi:hypothetical protein
MNEIDNLKRTIRKQKKTIIILSIYVILSLIINVYNLLSDLLSF